MLNFFFLLKQVFFLFGFYPQIPKTMIFSQIIVYFEVFWGVVSDAPLQGHKARDGTCLPCRKGSDFSKLMHKLSYQ